MNQYFARDLKKMPIVLGEDAHSGITEIQDAKDEFCEFFYVNGTKMSTKKAHKILKFSSLQSMAARALPERAWNYLHTFDASVLRNILKDFVWEKEIILRLIDVGSISVDFDNFVPWNVRLCTI